MVARNSHFSLSDRFHRRKEEVRACSDVLVTRDLLIACRRPIPHEPPHAGMMMDRNCVTVITWDRITNDNLFREVNDGD